MFSHTLFPQQVCGAICCTCASAPELEPLRRSTVKPSAVCMTRRLHVASEPGDGRL